MLSQKAIDAKISNLEAKLAGLYKQIDPVCSSLKSNHRPRVGSVNSFSSNKGRGRPPKEGVEKLIELQNKLKSQTKKMEEELERVAQGISKQVKDLNAEIEQKKMIMEKTINISSKIKHLKANRLRDQRAVNYNEQYDNGRFNSLIIRTRNARGRFISTRSNGSGVSSRLRTRNTIVSDNQEMRKTRSMLKLPQSEIKNVKYDTPTVIKSTKKRDTKSMEKDVSSTDDTPFEDLKIKNYKKFSNREKYFNKGNAIYQEYDEFLKRRRKDKRIEFIKIKNEPGEEILNMKNNKDLLKYFGGSTEDTF
jgi:hypothetical protein